MLSNIFKSNNAQIPFGDQIRIVPSIANIDKPLIIIEDVINVDKATNEPYQNGASLPRFSGVTLLYIIVIGRPIINNKINQNEPEFGASEYASPLISFWYTFFSNSKIYSLN